VPPCSDKERNARVRDAAEFAGRRGYVWVGSCVVELGGTVAIGELARDRGRRIAARSGYATSAALFSWAGRLRLGSKLEIEVVRSQPGVATLLVLRCRNAE